MFKFFLVVATFLFSYSAFGQNSCMVLEGINLGCVSSVDHSCRMNKKVDEPRSRCSYVGSPGVQWRVEGPISFVCESWTQTIIHHPRVCNGEVCVTPPPTITSTCVRYQPPICEETCIKCFNEVVEVPAGRSRGCIVCTRPKCQDEPDVSSACPPTYNGLVNHLAQKCSADIRCPTSAVDPNGVTHPVTVRRGTCPPAVMPPIPPDPPEPQHCPWKVDERSRTGCEPISPDNRNP